MMKSNIGLLLLLLLIVSCTKQENVPVTQVVATQPNIQIIITTKYLEHNNQSSRISLPGASVRVFKTMSDAQSHAMPVKYGTSGSDGKVKFEYLGKQNYVVEASYPDMDTGRITVRYVSGAVVSYEDVVLMKH